MINWINWAVLEKQVGWAAVYKDSKEYDENWNSRERAEAMYKSYALGLDTWVNEHQAQALNLQKDETVLDACCGTGRLTIPMAKYCKKVVGLDGGDHLLDVVQRRANDAGLTNVSVLQKNWFAIEPGVDIPKFDVVIGCNCPALADLKKFSKAAAKRCIYMHGCCGPLPRVIIDDLFRGTCKNSFSGPITDAPGEDDAWTSSKNTFDISFNRLINLGASPSIRYCEGGWHVEAANRERLYDKIRSYREVLPEKEHIFRANVDKYTIEIPDGVCFERKHTMVIMEWDPNQIDFSLE